MNIKSILEKLKYKLNYISVRKEYDLIETKDLYLCEIRMVSSYEMKSIIRFNYQLSSSAFILARKNEKNEYEDIFDNRIYENESNIKPEVGNFFVTRIAKVQSKTDFVTKEELKIYLLKIRYNLIKDSLIQVTDFPVQYNCGNDEICGSCHVCGTIEYESLLLDISSFPICTACYNKIKSNEYVNKKTK